MNGTLGFIVVGLIGAGLLAFSWRLIAGEHPPRWLLWLTIGAVALRFGLSVFWSVALPAWGYDTDVQRAGYVMEDAHKREAIAWRLAQSSDPLYLSFFNYSATDQYGGLLFVDAAIYRYVGGSVQQPLHTNLLAAWVSGLAVLFTWAVTKKLWGEKAAQLAAWLVTFFPEALLLGSSQMREAYTVALVPLAVFLLLAWVDQWDRRWLAGLIAALVLTFAISQPFAAQLGASLVLIGLVLKWAYIKTLRGWKLFVPIGLLMGFVAFFIWQGGLFALQDAVAWQSYVSQSASGWVARQFERMPAWSHVPFLVFYGILRPLLPAALIADGALLWRVVGSIRALGWMLALAMLLYASLLAVLQGFWRKLPGLFLALVWIQLIFASYRGGGDIWDNPRYRSAFTALQMAMVAWAWLRQRESKDPWLRRALVGAGISILWFIPWYLRRYTAITWTIVDLPDVAGLIFASFIVYVLTDHFLGLGQGVEGDRS